MCIYIYVYVYIKQYIYIHIDTYLHIIQDSLGLREFLPAGMVFKLEGFGGSALWRSKRTFGRHENAPGCELPGDSYVVPLWVVYYNP